MNARRTTRRAIMIVFIGTLVAATSTTLQAEPATPSAGDIVQSPRSIVSGEIGRPNGSPLAGITVMVFRANGALTASVETDQHGVYMVLNLDPVRIASASCCRTRRSDSFPRLAPTLWKSWQSWGVNSGGLTGRLTAAAPSMREGGRHHHRRILDAAARDDQTSLGLDQYIRGTATLEDVQTGLRYNGSYFDASTILQARTDEIPDRTDPGTATLTPRRRFRDQP